MRRRRGRALARKQGTTELSPKGVMEGITPIRPRPTSPYHPSALTLSTLSRQAPVTSSSHSSWVAPAHLSDPSVRPILSSAPRPPSHLCRATVGAEGPAVQPQPLPAGAPAALAAPRRLGRPLGRHLLAAVPALRPRGPGGCVRAVRAARGLLAAPGRAAGRRRHAAAPAARGALHGARGGAQRRLGPGGRRGSHLRAGHRLHRARG